MRIAALATVALLSSFTLAGCGGDDNTITKSGSSGEAPTTQADDSSDSSDSSDDDPDREALVAYIAGSDGTELDREQGDCVADTALGDLSESGLDTIRAGGDFDLSAFGSDDSDLLIAALDECVPLTDAVASFQEGISGDETFPLSDTEAECTSLSFAKEYEGAGEFIAAVTAMSEDEAGARLFDAMGGCISVDSATEFMASIIAEQGLDQAQADCIAGNIVDQLGVEGLLDAISESGTTGSSSTFDDASAAAAAACGAAGASGGDIGGGISGN